MKNCHHCGAQMPDESKFCPVCGVSAGAQGSNPNSQYASSYDHTAEFDPKDISENKVLAMLCYLMGVIGIILALLGSHESRYAGFHVRQALKFVVVEALLVIIAIIFAFTLLVPILCGIFALILVVVKIICFFSICSGKATEPPIIRSFGFLK